MHKILTLAVAVSVLPVSRQYYPLAFNNDAARESRVYLFPYINTTTNPRPDDLFGLAFEPEKKTIAEPWSSGWMAQAQENIRKSEYHFVWEEKLKAYCTPNRKNNLRFFYTSKGFSVKPRTTKIPIGEFDPMKRPDEIKYKTIPNWKVEFGLDKEQVGRGNWQVGENQAEYLTDKVTVQYINSDEGMRQNFIVHTPLSDDSELKINFSIKTKLNTYLHGNQLQFFHKKTNVLNYDRLKVWDANGKSLNASILKAKRNKFYIQVDTKNAVYPITIDPLSNTPNSTPDDANQASSGFGISVASAGDVNADGFSDVIIGAYQFDDGANSSEGRSYVYHGSASGLSASPNSMQDDANQASAGFGQCVSSAGDVDGDGYSDVIIGATGYIGATPGGGAFIYYGSGTGLLASPGDILDDANQTGAYFGDAVAGAGDVNGDGYSDVIIGARYYDVGGNTNEGRIWVYHGSASGISAAAPSIRDDANQAIAFYGSAVNTAGDVNGDGYSDVIVGAYFYDDPSYTNEGRAFVYHGSASGISATPNSTPDDAQQVASQFAIAVASAGDVNGDGYGDVIIGASIFDDPPYSSEGRAFVYYGSSTGLSGSPNVILSDANSVAAGFGCSVACAGDINADGYGDVIVGAQLFDDGGNNQEGRAFVYMGSSTGLTATFAYSPDDANQVDARFGLSVASAGDVNGDGYSDVIVGAFLYDDGATVDEGGAFVYHGSPSGLSVSPTNNLDDGNQAGANFGYSVSLAGDVNADGYSDVIIGAYQFDDGANTVEGRAFVYHGSVTGLSATPNSTLDDADQADAQFGFSVSTAGDVNGDGYSDVVIGAPLFNDGANTDEGRAFVYHGSAAGLSASPNNLPDDANQAGAQFGYSVACAGDVNSNGYSDLIIGAPYYDDSGNADEGRAFLYFGVSSGLQASPVSIVDDANQAGAYLGCSVATAGDANADGKSDVIIGAYGYDDGGNTDEGRAFVYYGTGTGLPASPSSTPDDANQAGANFGYSVACAGDVNGDGDNEVLIGAPEYDDGANTAEGRVYVYHGSGTGLSATPNSTLDDCNQAGARFGISVSTAGDVNGDGYSDVVIGAAYYDDGANTEEGRAFIYQGSSSGLPAAPNTTLDDANQAGARFGISVGTAGDVNGDGYSDVLLGAYLYNDGANADEGRSFVYNGNEFSTNKRNNIRLYNSNLTTPINSTNINMGNFGAGLFAKSFLGRVDGKLVWETRLNYNGFSGTPITNSVTFTAQQAAYSDLGTAGLELKNLITKILGTSRYTKLRARVKYRPSLAITGQVYGPWRYTSTVLDANNLGVLPIELISFNAAWIEKGRSAKLDFKTDKESGICCFDIEKSLDGFNFTDIGSLPAKNISGIQSYQFTDQNATGKNQYYRIRIKGIGGQIEYSNIQLLNSDKATEILVFPNPTADVLQLQLNNPYNKMDVQVINAAGQTVKQLNNLAPSNQSLSIPVRELAPGRYWLKLQSGGEKQVLQFVKF